MSESAKSRTADAPGQRSRAAALAILSQVLRRRRALDQAADEILANANLQPRDAGFARAIAGETLRRFGQLDALLRAFMPKPLAPHRAGPALEILLMGACELVFLTVAPHAAVDGANRLAQADAKAVHFKPLVNAVLRRVTSEGAAIVSAQDAARLNTPDWLWERWCAAYGAEVTRAMAQAHLARPPLDLAFKTPDNPCPENMRGIRLAPGLLRLQEFSRVEALPGFAQGEWWVQDAAASIPARLLGDVAGKRVLDLCAAPGGKTAQLAATGARVVAVDLAPERLARVRENLVRLKLDAELIAADLCDWRPQDPAPFVLLDAPCTATGAIRRHPDLPWIKSAADITHCADAQSEFLDAAAAMTAPGGLLVYAVCSLEPEEGVEQTEMFLRRHKDFARMPVRADETFGDAALISAEGDLRTLPCHWAEKGGMDGFYAARFKRASL